MLDIEKIDKEATNIIRSFTKGQLLEFVDWYHQEIALAKKEERMAKLNGAPQNAAISQGVTIKKPLARSSKKSLVVSH